MGGRERKQLIGRGCRGKLIDKTWLYCDGGGVFEFGCWGAGSGLLKWAGPARGGG